jgi:hypothetical protein
MILVRYRHDSVILQLAQCVKLPNPKPNRRPHVVSMKYRNPPQVGGPSQRLHSVNNSARVYGAVTPAAAAGLNLARVTQLIPIDCGVNHNIEGPLAASRPQHRESPTASPTAALPDIVAVGVNNRVPQASDRRPPRLTQSPVDRLRDSPTTSTCQGTPSSESVDISPRHRVAVAVTINRVSTDSIAHCEPDAV